MKRLISLCLLTITIVTFVSCGNGNPKPIKSESLDYDCTAAAQMVMQGDSILAKMALRDTVTRTEFDDYMKRLKDIYGEDVKWAELFFKNEEYENSETDTLTLKKDVFYPTLLHQGIEVVSAEVENTCYDNDFFNQSLLTIKIAYSGEDSKLQDWYREYLYTKDADGQWRFYGFGGVMNFTEDGFTADYLKLK